MNTSQTISLENSAPSAQQSTKALAWLFLLVAVAVEIVGVVLMKLLAAHGGVATLLCMYAMIGLSFYFLGLAMRRLSLAVSYASWETLGLLAVTLIGWAFFQEELGATKILGLAVILGGVVLVNTDEAAE